MPQLDFTTFPSQIFWIMVGFGLFYILTSRMILPKIGSALEGRQKYIADFLNKATQLKDQASEVKRSSKNLLEEVEVQEKAEIEQAMLAARGQLDAYKKRIEGEYAEKYAKLVKNLSKDAEAVLAALSSEALVIANDFTNRYKSAPSSSAFFKE
ncbi:MAG: hypothetical protein LBL30_02620 [Holosporales bacterium]|jgi:F-type H+-transporting ATPase subunit b|nr:hypothetical protein [Holosporales bacterium]